MQATKMETATHPCEDRHLRTAGRREVKTMGPCYFPTTSWANVSYTRQWAGKYCSLNLTCQR